MNGLFVIIGIALLMSVFALYSPQISAWCDKQLAKKDDKNAPQRAFFVSNELADFYPVNRPESVTNLQSVMEVYRTDQVSKIFAKSV